MPTYSTQIPWNQSMHTTVPHWDPMFGGERFNLHPHQGPSITTCPHPSHLSVVS